MEMADEVWLIWYYSYHMANITSRVRSINNLISVTVKRLHKFLETNSTQSMSKSSVFSLYVHWSTRFLHWFLFQLFYFFKKLRFSSSSLGYCIIRFCFCKFGISSIIICLFILSGYFYQKANFERIWSFHIWNHCFNQRLVLI